MKYLLKYAKETILTAIMIVVMVYVLYNGIKCGETVQSIIEAITFVLVWYFNMPTSAEGDSAKIDMLQNKRNRHNPIECDEPEEE